VERYAERSKRYGDHSAPAFFFSRPKTLNIKYPPTQNFEERSVFRIYYSDQRPLLLSFSNRCRYTRIGFFVRSGFRIKRHYAVYRLKRI
jgi:hypothetical protein